MQATSLGLLLLLVFMIPWEDTFNLFGVGTLPKLAGAALLGVWLAKVVIEGRIRRPGTFHILAALFVIWNALSITWSANASATFVRLTTYAQLFVLLFIMWDLLTTRTTLATALQMYVLGGFVAATNTLYNFLAGNTDYFERYTARGTNPDDLGAVLALGVPIAFYLAMSAGTGGVGRILRWVNFAYVPMALLGIALSGTRLALVAVVPGIMFGLVSLTHLRWRSRIAILLFLVAAAFVVVPVVPQASIQRLGTIGTEISSGDLSGRIGIWQDGVASITRHPLLGVGSNMFRSVNAVGKVAHNSFLSVLVEVGLIGFLVFAAMLATAVIQAVDQPRLTSQFWLTTLVAWGIIASALTWEHRKPTWLVLGLTVVSASVMNPRLHVEARGSQGAARRPQVSPARFNWKRSA